MSDRRTTAVLAFVIVLGTVPGVAAPAGATGPTGTTEPTEATQPTRIDSCTVITESGEYVLADDVVNGSPTNPRMGLGACIAVRADDVTLRGGNHTVAAKPGGGPGVVGVLVGRVQQASGEGDGGRPSNVTVTNLTTTRWGAGVAVVGATDATLRNVSAVNNLGDGFFVENSPGAELVGATIRGSNTGVFLRRSPDARLADLTLVENLAGISVRRSPDTVVSDVTASKHSQFGVAAFSSANATIRDSTFAGNGFADVAFARADDVRLRNITIPADSATRWGIYAAERSTATGERVRFGETEIDFDIRGTALDSATDAPPLPTERQVVGDPILAAPTGESARLSLSATSADAAVDRVSVTEESLSLWRFDAGEGWRPVETTIDAERNRASATFGNLSRNGTVIALVGEGLAEAENGTVRG